MASRLRKLSAFVALDTDVFIIALPSSSGKPFASLANATMPPSAGLIVELYRRLARPKFANHDSEERRNASSPKSYAFSSDRCSGSAESRRDPDDDKLPEIAALGQAFASLDPFRGAHHDSGVLPGIDI